ncbi:MAG: iron-only hydrogenase system regulator [candidate division KSB1 bacterium]|nr:iron-only hydrogenase system regulator [candidate division KSB1 bacterium]MDZ7336563.1 iron-only hydrogenase system regulator [candidate division KSB1 bacterium]MDZ7357765.1 iron-only hydrogenase system regulator [candidate division KSB1 bacterium]MDZ7375330.1 iron-only hydrogenase system regulator [candidate division KSB1 bacterium]MDZ7400246.1 iron-only hydrogenase system regulator [candidate division KSB1 bacterium]
MNNQNKERKIGFVGIIVYDRDAAYQKLNQILHDYSSIIIGRMGLPYRERNLSIISLIVDGSGDEIGAMTGKIGQLPGITVRAEFAKLI